MFVGHSSEVGGLAVGVPGELRGLHLAKMNHGSSAVSWKELVMPAAQLAKRWVISKELRELMKHVEKPLRERDFPLLSELYLDEDGKLKEAGDIIEQPLLSHTLSMIAEYGADYLYETMAEELAVDIRSAGGVVSQEDIRNYQPVIHEALTTDAFG